MKKKLLFGIWLSILLIGCSTSKKIELSVDGKYFEIGSTELYEKIAKEVPSKLKASVEEDVNGEPIVMFDIGNSSVGLFAEKK